MAFCSNCGSEVGGQFCPKCGTRQAGGAPSLGPSTSGLTSNVASALCYIPLIGIIFLVVDPFKKDPETRFHAWQSIFLFVAFIVLRMVVTVIGQMSWSLGASLAMLVGFGELGLMIFLAVKAYNNQRIVLPVVGQLAEKQV